MSTSADRSNRDSRHGPNPADAVARNCRAPRDCPGIHDRVDSAIDAARESLGDDAFNIEFTEATSCHSTRLSPPPCAVRGSRARAAMGWASLTPTERSVVEVVWRVGRGEEVAAVKVLPRGQEHASRPRR